MAGPIPECRVRRYVAAEYIKTRYHESRDHRGNGRRTEVASTQPVVKFTYEDYLATPDDERYELLDGDLIMVPAPNLKHQRVLLELARRLAQFIKDRGLGELFIAPCDVYLSETNVVQPDLLFVSRAREHLLSDGQKVRGAPDLVIEILSPSTETKDRSLKRDLYGRHGVTEYWLVDPVAETISIHRQRGGVLAATHTFGRGQTLRSALFAGLELRLDDVSRLEAERWADPWRERHGASQQAAAGSGLDPAASGE